MPIHIKTRAASFSPSATALPPTRHPPGLWLLHIHSLIGHVGLSVHAMDLATTHSSCCIKKQQILTSVSNKFSILFRVYTPPFHVSNQFLMFTIFSWPFTRDSTIVNLNYTHTHTFATDTAAATGFGYHHLLLYLGNLGARFGQDVLDPALLLLPTVAHGESVAVVGYPLFFCPIAVLWQRCTFISRNFCDFCMMFVFWVDTWISVIFNVAFIKYKLQLSRCRLKHLLFKITHIQVWSKHILRLHFISRIVFRTLIDLRKYCHKWGSYKKLKF